MKSWLSWAWERRKRDLNEELEAHLRLAIEDRVSRGEDPEAARTAALQELGNMPLIADVTRERWGFRHFDRIWNDVRFAMRQLRRSPGFAITAVLGLALGIGPVVAIFSMIWATFLAPPPYPNASQLVVVWNHYKGERSPTSGEDYAQLAAQSHSFQSLSFLSWIVVHLTNRRPHCGPGRRPGITPGLQTKTVGQPLLLGRDFLPEEGSPGNDHVVILSNWLWHHRYNSDPNILGKSILIENQPYTVVGVMRAGPHERGGGITSMSPFVPWSANPAANSAS